MVNINLVITTENNVTGGPDIVFVDGACDQNDKTEMLKLFDVGIDWLKHDYVKKVSFEK